MTRINTKFIADNAVTNSKLNTMPAATVKGNNTGSTGAALDLSVAQVQTLLFNTWSVYTPTLTGFGTATSVSAAYKQTGDSLQIRMYFVAGTVTATTASFTLPGGFNLSTSLSKIPVSNDVSSSGVGCGTYTAKSNTSNNFGTWMGSVLTAPATSTTLIYAGRSVTDLSNLTVPANGNAICDTGSIFTLQCEVILA